MEMPALRAIMALQRVWTWHFGKNYDYLGHAETWDEVEFKGDPYPPPFIGLFGKKRSGCRCSCAR